MSRNSKIIIATVVVVVLAVVSLVAVKGTGRKASETYVANKPPWDRSPPRLRHREPLPRP